MGFQLTADGFAKTIDALKEHYLIYAPVLKKGTGRFTDTDIVRYDFVNEASEIELERKSDYAFKEFLTPLSETLLFFTEDQVKAADIPDKPVLIFLRSCDLHAVRRQDDMYLNNGWTPDWFFKRRRDLVKFVLIGCKKSYQNCFCVSMGSNRSEDGYVFSVETDGDGFACDVPDTDFVPFFAAGQAADIKPSYVTKNDFEVRVPDQVPGAILKHTLWDEYSSRCIGCGRCNYVCPTCTCYTMQDIFYHENGKVGERRRVAAACMVDGFTNVAGGGEYRKSQGERMRYRVLHKISDHKKRFGENMCIGCGRCDDACPEYISYSNILNKVTDAVENLGKEVQ